MNKTIYENFLVPVPKATFNAVKSIAQANRMPMTVAARLVALKGLEIIKQQGFIPLSGGPTLAWPKDKTAPVRQEQTVVLNVRNKPKAALQQIKELRSYMEIVQVREVITDDFIEGILGEKRTLKGRYPNMVSRALKMAKTNGVYLVRVKGGYRRYMPDFVEARRHHA